jgi:hypothetical protein
MAADFNPRCVPPWSQGELAHAVDRAQANHTETPVEDTNPDATARGVFAND